MKWEINQNSVQTEQQEKFKDFCASVKEAFYNLRECWVTPRAVNSQRRFSFLQLILGNLIKFQGSLFSTKVSSSFYKIQPRPP